MSATVMIEDIGPWNGKHEFAFHPGVNVLVGPNGVGKTIFLSALSALASGDAKLPLRDGAKRGRVEGFGASITVGGSCRHYGECELENLEGKLSIAALVEPGLKSPASADKKRIEALATLMDCKASIATFAGHAAFSKVDFKSIVGTKAAGMTDLCEMADQIAKDFQKAARDEEEKATKFRAEAIGLESACNGVDLTAESSDVALQSKHRVAMQFETTLVLKARQQQEAKERCERAKQRMAETKQNYSGPTIAEAEARRGTASTRLADANADRQRLELELNAAKQAEDAARRAFEETGRVLNEARRVADLLNECESIVVETTMIDSITAADIEAASADVKAAHEAILLGERIRKAKENLDAARQKNVDAEAHDKNAAQLRAAGKSVGQVLSEAIQNKYLWVEAVDDVARLVAKHPTRGTVPFDELSAGERWRIAIDLAADLVGEGGLIVIDQEGWEGIDAFVRPDIHAHATERKVIVVTAEATRDSAQGSTPRLERYAEKIAA